MKRKCQMKYACMLGIWAKLAVKVAKKIEHKNQKNQVKQKKIKLKKIKI